MSFTSSTSPFRLLFITLSVFFLLYHQITFCTECWPFARSHCHSSTDIPIISSNKVHFLTLYLLYHTDEPVLPKNIQITKIPSPELQSLSTSPSIPPLSISVFIDQG